MCFGQKLWGPRKHLCFWGEKYGVPENIYVFGVLWGPRKRLPFLGCYGVPENACIFGDNKYGVPENACIFGEKKMAAQNVNFVACGQVGFPHGLLLVANEAVPL